MKRFVFLILLFSFVLCLSGCTANKSKNVILFNKEPITKENLTNNSILFDSNKKIYYIFISEKKIESKIIRVRVLKREEKVNLMISGVIYSNDFRLYKDQVYYYNDYLVIHDPGYYCMVVYGIDRLDKPLAMADFRVK